MCTTDEDRTPRATNVKAIRYEQLRAHDASPKRIAGAPSG
jgi:hypothetical protein